MKGALKRKQKYKNHSNNIMDLTELQLIWYSNLFVYLFYYLLTRTTQFFWKELWLVEGLYHTITTIADRDWGTQMGQLWEQSLPTNVARVRAQPAAVTETTWQFRIGACSSKDCFWLFFFSRARPLQYVCGACQIMFSEHRALWILRFSCFHKKQHLKIIFRPRVKTRMKTTRDWCGFVSKYCNLFTSLIYLTFCNCCDTLTTLHWS